MKMLVGGQVDWKTPSLLSNRLGFKPDSLPKFGPYPNLPTLSHAHLNTYLKDIKGNIIFP